MNNKTSLILALALLGTLGGSCKLVRGPNSFLHVYSPEPGETFLEGEQIVLRAGVQICGDTGGAFPVRVFLDGSPLMECAAPWEGAELEEITTLVDGEILCALPSAALPVGTHELLVEVEIVEERIEQVGRGSQGDRWQERCHRDYDHMLAEQISFEVTPA